jgi:glycosyltransferase involved in cell wall biosynthesis
MKICYLSSVLTVHDKRFLAELAKRNTEVCLVTYFEGELPAVMKDLRGVRIIHRRPRYFRGFQKYLFAAKVNDFRGVLKEIKPDIVHGGYAWKDGLLAALSGFHPYLLMPWGSDILQEPRKSRICRWMVSYAISKADTIACDCRTVKERIMELADYPEERIKIFPWGVDLDLFKKTDGASGIRKRLGWGDNKVIISTRSFYTEYAIDTLIAALPAVFSAEPSARMLLLGTGPEERKLREMVKARGLEDVVHFAGKISNPDIPDYLNAADIYVSSSMTDGTSISLQEAFACGLPVVVNDVPANLEWVDSGVNGLVARIGDSKDLSEKLVRLLKDRELRKSMKENNLRIAKERADWEKNFDELQKVYTGLVESFAKKRVTV